MNIRRLFSLNYIDSALREVRNIFPITILSLLTLFFVATLMVHGGDLSQELSLWLSWGLSALFASMLFAILEFKMFHEQYEMARRWIDYAVGSLLVLGFYVGLPENISNVSAEFFIALMLVFGTLGVALVLLRAFLDRSEDEEGIRQVLAHLLSLAQGGIISLVLFIFGAIILGTLNVLFGLSFDGSWFAQWFVFTSLLIFPLFSLVQLVRTKSIDISRIGFFQVMTKFVLVPFTLLYGLILYAYVVRVLFFLDSWPSGVVPWLIMGYFVAGLLTYFFVKHISYDAISRFKTIFSLSAFPLLGLLFYAILIRILSYGWTMNRYFVVMIGIWLFSVALILFFSKAKNIFKMGLSLIIVLLVAMVGPCSIFAVSERSQTSRLIEQLERVTTFENNIPLPLTVAQRNAHRAELSSLRSRINYLCEYHGCDRIDTWNSELGLNDGEQYWNKAFVFTEYLGIETYYREENNSLIRMRLFLDPSSINFETDGPARIYGVSQYLENNTVVFKGRDITRLVADEYRSTRDAAVILHAQEELIISKDEIDMGIEPSQVPLDISAPPIILTVGDDTLYFYRLMGEIEGDQVRVRDVAYFVVESK